MKVWLARWGLIYPVHFLRGEKLPFYQKEVAAVERLSDDALQGYQERKLSRLLQRCYRKDPYYRKVLDRIGAPQSMEHPFEFFHELPILTKEIIREEEKKRTHRLWHFLDRRATSGSTGTPFQFFKDRHATGYMEAVQNQAFQWHGIAVGTPQGRFWGMPAGKQGKLASLKDFLKNRIRFSAFDLSDRNKEHFLNELGRFRPGYLYGYPSLMLEFGRSIGRERLQRSGISLNAVIGTGEYVSDDEKHELSSLFGAPFAGEYGCTETGLIGFDCQYGNMHLMAANILIEVVGSDGRPLGIGQEGEIVVTELNAGYFPFLRYQLGDRGCLVKEQCRCGRSLPLIKILAGRRDDFILTPEGNKVYDAILAYTLKEGIVQFQAVQEQLDYLRVMVCVNNQFTQFHENKYVAELREALGPSMRIEIQRVENIPRQNSGKLRYFRSEIREFNDGGK